MTDDGFDYAAFMAAEAAAHNARVAAAERARIIQLLRDNYGDDYTGPVNLAAVLRIIGGTE